MPTYSKFQEDIFKAIEDGKNSLVIEAVAGSGKTTTIVKATEKIDLKTRKTIFIAFNKKIVEELNTKLPKGISASTFNSVGWNAWRNFIGFKKQIEIDSKKTLNIVNRKFSEDDNEKYGLLVAKLVSYAKSAGLTPDSENSEWLNVIDHHQIDNDLEPNEINRWIDLAKKTLQVSIDIADRICDFDDQIYMPWYHNITFPKYDVVIVDEAQDTNFPQKCILRMLLRNNGIVVAVGDSRQGIYGFRGAGANSMAEIKNEFEAVAMPLSICYRCAKSIVKEAQKYNPDIQYWDQSPEGTVVTLQKYSEDTFLNTDAIICRKNAPLLEMAYSFIGRRIPVNLLGRDIATNLLALVKKISKKNTPIKEFNDKMKLWKDTEIERLNSLGEEKKAENILDRVKCIEVVLHNCEEIVDTDALKREIESICSKENRNAITLCSFHKSKGAEWNRVFILDFNTSVRADKEWKVAEENNLRYVAVTRAKQNLFFIESKKWE